MNNIRTRILKNKVAFSQSKILEGRVTLWFHILESLPGGSVVKNLFANAGDMGLIPGLGISPGERNGNLL